LRIGLVWLALSAAAHAQLVRQPASTLALPATLPAATGYTLQNALGSLTFSAPIDVDSLPGQTNALFVAERAGLIQRVNLTANPPTKAQWFAVSSILGAGERVITNVENGLLSLAFHPGFASNGTFFVFYSLANAETDGTGDTNDCLQRVHRVTVANPLASPAVVASHQPLITQYDQATNHNGGDMHFGPDGYLYVSMGDEGGANDTFNNARFIDRDFFGGVLRLDVDRRPGSLAPHAHTNYRDTNRTTASTSHPSAVHRDGLGQAYYGIPPDNPFIGRTTWHNLAVNPNAVRTEWYATGLRNPWRFAFDPPTGRLFLADVGQDIYEEINLVSAGDDLGWSWREGLHPFTPNPAPKTPPATGFNPVDPIFEYDHTDNGVGNDAILHGRSITGGRVARGTRLPELFGKYIFADYSTRIVAALTEQPNGTWTGQQLMKGDHNLVAFGLDPRNGDVLVCEWGSGNRVSRLVRSGTTGTAPPALLSQTGAFADLAALTPQPGLVPYAPNLGFWSDHAVKTRWFALTNLTDRMTFRADAPWDFPAGQVWVKHFELELTRGDPSSRRRLETRFLVKSANGGYGVTYRWRPDGLEADLVPEEGQQESITVQVGGQPTPQVWRYPSRSECLTCHTPQTGFALSMSARQLNREATFGAQTQNLLRHLEQAGYFTGSVPDPRGLPAFAAPDDTAHSLDWRVRSYLEVNCVSCHLPGGAALGHWDARSHVPLDAAGLIDGALVNTGGDPDQRLAAPGQPSRSMLLNRLEGTGFPRMPPLSSSLSDPAAIALVTEWVLSLTNRLSFAQWQALHFGSPAHPEADGALDPDLDLQSNAWEYLARTSPTNTSSRFTWEGVFTNGVAAIRFPHPAGRACLIETSTNLTQWTLWEVPGNDHRHPADTQWRTVAGEVEDDRQYFRLRLSEP
jgi:glucose/arabinose dehydrogenase